MKIQSLANRGRPATGRTKIAYRICLPPELRLAAARVACTRDISLSAYVREAIAAHLSSEKERAAR